MTYRRGRPFSEYFLSDGVRQLPGYAALCVAAVASLDAVLVEKIGAILAMHGPLEATNERDLIEPVLKALGWHDFAVQQALAKTAHRRSRLSAVCRHRRQGARCRPTRPRRPLSPRRRDT